MELSRTKCVVDELVRFVFVVMKHGKGGSLPVQQFEREANL